jgi:hypothetical protein
MRAALGPRLRLLLLAMSAWAAAGVTAAGPLPKLAVSLPAGIAPTEAARLVRACGSDDLLIILAPITVRIGDGADTPVEATAVAEVPSKAYLRLRVEVSDIAATGRDREALVERQVTDIVRLLALGRREVAGLVIESSAAPGAADVQQFALATLIVKARGAGPDLVIALDAPEGPAQQRLLAYADAVVLSSDGVAAAQRPRLGSITAGRPLTMRVSVGGMDSGRGGSEALLSILTSGDAAAVSTVWFELPGLAALRGLCATMQALARTLGAGFEMTAAERAPAAVLVEGRSASTAVAFVNSQAADVAVLLRSGGSREAPRTLSLAAAATGKPPQVTCVDAADGRRLSGGPASAGACRSDTDYVLLVARTPAGGDRLFEQVSVTGRAALRVEEIIARWQAAREAERLLLDNYSAPSFLVLHFEATNLSIAFDVALELEQYWDRAGVNDWVQTAMRVNGVKLRRGQAFPLPQLEPDKVVTKPLELRMDQKYVYELLGTETVDGRVCYVVGIGPEGSSESLYSGRVWIDGVDFRQVRLYLEQRDGKNNVAAHVETQTFGRVKDGRGREFALIRAIDAEDQVNIGGRSVTLEKRYRFGAYRVNTDDFPTRLAAARASDDPMFRDTEEGLRSLKRQGGELVLEHTASKVIKAALGGVLYDGGRTYPVPLAGVSWVDFDFRKTGTQLSAFFAGPLFFADLSRQVNKSFRWGVDVSLSALPNTFAEYQGNEELTDRRIRNFQQFVGALLNWQVTSALAVSTQFDVYHDLYQAAGETDPAYRVPASGMTLANYGEAKYARKGFSAMAAVEHGTRVGWRGFGYPDDPTEPVLDNWTRYSIEVSQHLYAGKLTRGGVSAGYFGGHNLDRFSRYTPSFFERPAINGLPSGVGAYDEITTLGGYYGFNVLDLAKLQGAYTHAWTRNKSEGNALKQFDGLNFSVGVGGPFGTFVQGSVNVALRGELERYASRWGIYMVVLKPWK